jgi:hypothetical protein
MTKGILLGLLLIGVLSCNTDSDLVKQEIGMVWLSGGLTIVPSSCISTTETP